MSDGRALGPWFMVPPWASISVAAVALALLAWYFVRLGREEVPAGRRRLRRASVVLLAIGLAPLVRALSFVHPHEDRVGWAVAWSSVLFVVLTALVLAIIDIVLVTRGGIREYREIRRDTFGGKGGGARGGTGDPARGAERRD